MAKGHVNGGPVGNKCNSNLDITTKNIIGVVFFFVFSSDKRSSKALYTKIKTRQSTVLPLRPDAI